MIRPCLIFIWILALAAMCGGCVASRERLTFPAQPMIRNETGAWYDVNRSGRPDFAILTDGNGRAASLAYDPDEDGTFDRCCTLAAPSAVADVPHLIIMLDSVPFNAVAARHAAGHFPWFDPPRKVIPPFPTMSGVIFTSIMHAPPLPGMINRYYDRSKGRTANLIVRRTFGFAHPWHEQMDYRAKYTENGLAFLWPRHWYRRELARAKQAFDTSAGPVTIVYLASSAGMLSRFGSDGLADVLDGLEQLCAQILYERAGAVHLSVLADHGHNLLPGKRISLDNTLKAAGFNPTNRLQNDRDVVIENDGMVNYIGMHTTQPAAIADAVLTRSEVQLAMYRHQDRVIVRNARGAALIERRLGRYRYSSLDADVLDYEPVLRELAAAGRADEQGFIADRDWFQATYDHEWPDAPPRIFKAFDHLVVNTPDLMLTLHDGYCTGLGFLELFISMASTHGGLNHINSATFVMTTTGRVDRPLRSDEIMPAIEPRVTPGVLPAAAKRAQGEGP